MTSQPAIPPDPTLTPDDLILLLFVLVDDLYGQRVPGHIRYRPGYCRLQRSDSEGVTL